MSYILSYSSLTLTNGRSDTQFGGSSKYKLIDGVLSEKPARQAEPKRTFTTIEKEVSEITGEAKQAKEKPLTNTFDVETFKTYTLNKSKVRRRCHALSRLAKSKKFLAFYTITFPEGISDKNCYRLFNLWLTRCRKTSGLNTYLWVAERQKNGTIHFHLLTNDFMEIATVNGYMAKALTNAKKRGIEKLATVETEKYNGVDVKKVGKKKKTLIGYLTKYITKNNIEFYRLPWHCSRDVSRLFTSLYFEQEDSEKYREKLPKNKDKYFLHESEYCKVMAFKFIPDDGVFIDLDVVNEVIYNAEGNTK